MIHTLCSWFTSNLQLRAAHPPELAVDRVYFPDQGDQDGVTYPLQKKQIFPYLGQIHVPFHVKKNFIFNFK